MTHQVVGCSTCGGFWILEDLRTTDTAECPLCFTQHQTKQLNVRFAHDDFKVAAEIRSKIVAEQAGHRDRYEDLDDYGVLGKQAEELHREREELLAEEADQAFEGWYSLYEDDAKRVFEERDRRLEEEARNALSDIHSRFEAEAERVFEEQDTRFADDVSLDHDYSAVETDDPEDIGTAGGLSLTRQCRFADVTTALDKSVSDISTAITSGLRDPLVAAIRDLADGRSALELQAVLHDADITAADADLLGLAARIARGDRQAAWEFVSILAETGGRSTTEDLQLAPRLLALADRTPTIAVRLDKDFWNLRRSQRKDICAFLSALARGCDLRVVASGIEQRRLVDDHREDLPVSREDITPPEASRDQRVEQATATLDPDAREVHVLRLLADEDSETLSYSALDSELTVSASRRSQVLSTLTDLGLADTFGPQTDKHAELLPAGRQFLDTLESEIARQRTLAESVSDVCNQSDDSRVTTPMHGEAGTGGGRTRHRLPALHTTETLPQWDATATAASTPEHGIGIVDYPLEEQQDRGSPRWFYDYQQDRLTIGAEYSNPMQYWVCVARALASRRTLSVVLDDGDRLDDTDDLAEFLQGHKHLLRDSTCLGYLPDDVEDGEDYLDELQAAEQRLCELTQDLAAGEFDSSESEYRSTITREAMGLAKTMLDLLDLVGVAVVQQVRLPTAGNGGRHGILADDDRPTLVKSLITAVKLQARIGRSSVYRQLFETDEDRREAAIEPAVDAFDVGEMAGSLCVVGDLGTVEDDLVREVRGRLGRVNEDIHEDAPEISVRVPVAATEDLDRTAFARAVERMAAAKNLRPTREAVSTLRLFVGTPFDAARAVHALSSEDEHRDLRLSEVRYGLSTLSARRVLPWETPGVSALVAALLAADRPLSGSEIADRADVSRSTWQNHRDWLDAVGLISESEQGWRLTLVFHTDAERYSEESFWFVKSSEDALPYPVLLSSLGMQVAMDLIDDESDREQVVSEIQQGWTTDPGLLEGRWPRITPWLAVFQSVVGDDSGTAEPVVFGRAGQASLQAATRGGVSA